MATTDRDSWMLGGQLLVPDVDSEGNPVLRKPTKSEEDRIWNITSEEPDPEIYGDNPTGFRIIL